MAAYDENDVLTYASAIAFKLTFALIPLALVGLGLLGAFDVADAWRTDVAPEVRRGVSPAVFEVIDQTVRQVLERKQLFWTTIGVVLWSTPSRSAKARGSGAGGGAGGRRAPRLRGASGRRRE